jgi:hypothetical protein
MIPQADDCRARAREAQQRYRACDPALDVTRNRIDHHYDQCDDCRNRFGQDMM